MNEMGIKKISTKKPLRRRTHSRKVAKDYIINIAEARREIVTALHLHRASSSSTTTTLPACSYVRPRVLPKEVAVNSSSTTTTTSSSSTGTHHQQYSLLMEPLPCPQPTWSTTPPSIHPPPLVPMEMIHEFEWGDNLASSYTWWIGFLKSLDGKKGNIQHENEGKHPLLFGEGIHHNKFHNSPKHGDLHFNNMGMEDQTSVLDEWLTVPASDEISDQK